MSPDPFELNVVIETEEIEIQVETPPDISVKLESLDTTLVVDSTPDVVVIATGGIGPPGPPGEPGVGTTFTYEQLVAAYMWDIVHNLNRYPSVTVIDSGGSEIIPEVQYTNENEIKLYFANRTSGKAYLN
jgi:hypothetical protein